jgi:DMSO/TMAO reductase YedYZ molybdopterin-dependent catalytic subunit
LNTIVYLIIAIGAILVIVLTGCSSNNTIIDSRTLEPVQIKEYQGEKLSSITDFRENSIKGAQYIDKASYRLNIGGLVNYPAYYTYEEVLSIYKIYTKIVKLDCVEGWSVTLLWEGTKINDLLQQADVLPAARVVIFHAYDGYTTSLPLQYLKEKDLLLAYKINGVVLPPDRGFPFQLVAEDKWGYKWIKWITRIELSDDENYKGYWERSGYSNDGSLDKPFFDR